MKQPGDMKILFCPADFPAPCGCKVRFDADGLVRFEQCKLHAAAPDLLAACQKAVKLLEYLHEEHNNTGVTLDEAIAKALGEEGQ